MKLQPLLRLVVLGVGLALALGACEKFKSLTGGSLFGSSSPAATNTAAPAPSAVASEPTMAETSVPMRGSPSEAPLVAALFSGLGLTSTDTALAATAVRHAATAAAQKPVAWANPATGNGGTVTVLRYGYDRDDRPCREFRSTLDGGLSKQVIACQDAQGIWRPRSS
jgi:surface antigen